MIIINRMFSGSYLKDNIGHEWINLFQADDEGFYLYLNSDGTFNKSRVTQFNKDNENGRGNYMLMVKNFDKGVWQVIAAAKLSEVASLDESKEETRIGESVEYNRVALMDIFSGNVALNKQEVTFKAEKVKFPASPILITEDKGTKGKNQDDDDGCLIIKRLNFAKQSLRQYVIKVGDSVVDSAYSNLLVIINKVLNSESSKSPSKVIPSLSKIKPTTLFEVIHKENDELMYSDMLKFYLEDEDFAKYFIKEVLELGEDEYVERVDREEFNIDLLIRTNKRLIVIENKIHSGINGKDKDLETQFKDAKKALQINSQNPISNSVEASQLTKYYIYAELLKQNDKPNSYFILCPEYKKNEIMSEKVYSSFYLGGAPVYNIVTYKKLYEKMLKYNGWINFSPDRNKYWSEFISVMERHTKDSAFDYELEQMRLKFLQATQMKKK